MRTNNNLIESLRNTNQENLQKLEMFKLNIPPSILPVDIPKFYPNTQRSLKAIMFSSRKSCLRPKMKKD